MEENNKESEIQVIEDEPVVEISPSVSEEVGNVEEPTNTEAPNGSLEYINDLFGKDSKLSAYSLLGIGILALVAVIICLVIAF